MKPYRIFISYCDDDIAQYYRNMLKSNEFVVWIDKEQLHKSCSGQQYWPCILEAINTAACYVVLLSANSLQNENVQKELIEAWRVKKERNQEDFVQFVILDEVAFNIELPLDTDKITFKGDCGYQVFLHFQNAIKAESDLLTFFSMKLDRPILITEKQFAFLKEFKYKVGKDIRVVRFITAFLFDIIFDNKGFWKVRLNPVNYRKEYTFRINGGYYEVEFNVIFSRLFGTIKSINQKVISALNEKE